MLSKILQSYLRFWAKRYLNRAKPQIIAITGSVGKTSAKEAIFEVLKTKFGNNVRKSEGNLNTETGVPLAILGYKQSPTQFYEWLPILFSYPVRALAAKKTPYLVLEMAADKPGDIKYLTGFVRPKVAVLTAIGPAHLAAFGSIDKIIEEKSNLLRALSADGWAVLNLDDERVRKISYGGRWQKITYGINQSADLMAQDISTQIIDFKPKTKFTLKGKIRAKVVSPTLGDSANICAMLAAAAVGVIYQASAEDIAAGLANLQSEKHRMNVLEGKNGSVIIDDCYNANPLSVKAALNVLKNLSGRKIAVLGEMREIGKITDESHRLLGAYAREVADVTVSVGALAKKYGFKTHFANKQKAIDYLLKEIRQGDIILIKASRAIGLEEIVKKLKSNS